ncbi:MAG: threonine synthase [Spirochaetia bacterium]|jgi:threonine synthase|nr:threonine synthase [Spirochaetia bacterium]
MEFISTRGKSPAVSASVAIRTGLAPDGGLYVPKSFPNIEISQVQDNYADFAVSIIQPFFEADPLYDHIPEICEQSFSFDVPLHWLNEKQAVLELFHGPTAAFKDFGARFLASVMEKLQQGQDRDLTILVATSGDTGSAVASAFYGKKGINVKVLYPEGRVSERQEKQLTCWGGNIESYCVTGNFDDCQKMVKTAFRSEKLAADWDLTSANSINLGRLLPQIVYFYYSSLLYLKKTGAKPVIIIPSGNVGNSAGAYWAVELGAPVEKIVLAVNANTTIPDFIKSGEYTPRASVATIANAMDVGDPSNMERLRSLFPSHKQISDNLESISVSDDMIRDTIRKIYDKYNYIMCPHTAAAEWVRQNMYNVEPGIVISTAHPAKFETIVEPEIGQSIEIPESLRQMMGTESKFSRISPDINQLF